eukprot:m.513393 g.513393  ORF g.513393 m.513393 type:complete len:193 (-) comp21905_c0_seq2:198-776(-)
MTPPRKFGMGRCTCDFDFVCPVLFDASGIDSLGKRKTIFVKPCVSQKLYADRSEIYERHRHRYEVNPKLISDFEEKGLQFCGRDESGDRMEILELDDHPYFCGTQFHPEFLSRPMRPAPVFHGFILAACGKLKQFIANGRITPTQNLPSSVASTPLKPAGSGQATSEKQEATGTTIASVTLSPVGAVTKTNL